MKLGRYIVGLISGLTFGMLFAPKKGKKLRDELAKVGEGSGQEALMALFNAFKDAGADAATEMKKLSESEQLQSALNMSKDKMRDYLSELEEHGSDMAACCQDKMEEFSDVAAAASSAFKKRAVRKKKVVTKAVNRRTKKVRRVVKVKVNAVKKVAKKVAPKKKKVTAKKAKKKVASKKK